MRPSTLFRTSGALLVLPVTLFFVAQQYLLSTRPNLQFWPYPWAPTWVQQPVEVMYAFAYAAVSAAAAWQSARLRRDGVWLLAPARPVWQVVALTLVPPIVLGWVTLCVPVALAFLERPTVPTPASLPPLLLGLALCVAHAVLGYAVGRRLPPLLSVPLLMVGVFAVVSRLGASETFAWRHLNGAYMASLGYGESATGISMLAHLLPTASLAVAVLLLSSRLPKILGGLVGVGLVWAACVLAYGVVDDWDFNPSLHVGADRTCVGESPEVCSASVAAADLPEIQHEAARTYAVLVDAGAADEVPTRLEDPLGYGRFWPREEPGVRVAPLTTAYRSGHLADELLASGVRYGCDADPVAARTVTAWLAPRVGASFTYDQVAAEDPYWTERKHARVERRAAAAARLPEAAQRDWLASMKRRACRGSL